MRGHSVNYLIAGWVWFAALTTPSLAQDRCPEGRTISGTCVDPALAQGMRLRVIVFTQPKFSYTAPPYLPYDDRIYRVPPQVHEVYQLYTSPPVTSTVSRVPIFTTPFVFIPAPTPRP